MPNPVNDKFQPIWASIQILNLTTASATSSIALPTCGAFRILSGGSPLYFSATVSASSAAGVGIMMLPANTLSPPYETGGGIVINFKVDTSVNPMQANIIPLV